jgi:hypothetical protein
MTQTIERSRQNVGTDTHAECGFQLSNSVFVRLPRYLNQLDAFLGALATELQKCACYLRHICPSM